MSTSGAAGSATPPAVRPARPADAAAMGSAQSRSWRLAYADLLGQDVIAELTPQALAGPWREAIAAPPSSRHRVLVAVADSVVVGFVALAGIEIAALVVDPLHQRRGHGSRLLAAAVDVLRGDGARRVQIWAPQRDTALIAFLGTTGVVADGAHRTYERADGVEITELRLAASLDD